MENMEIQKIARIKIYGNLDKKSFDKNGPNSELQRFFEDFVRQLEADDYGIGNRNMIFDSFAGFFSLGR